MQLTETAYYEKEMSFIRKPRTTLTAEYIYLIIAIVAFLIASFVAIQQYAVVAY